MENSKKEFPAGKTPAGFKHIINLQNKNGVYYIEIERNNTAGKTEGIHHTFEMD